MTANELEISMILTNIYGMYKQKKIEQELLKNKKWVDPTKLLESIDDDYDEEIFELMSSTGG